MSNEQPNQPQEPHTQSASTQPEQTQETDQEGKPIVSICSACEWAGEKGYEFAQMGADAQVVDELRKVHQQVQANLKKYTFTHGTCEKHLLQSVNQMQNMTPEKAQTFLQRAKLKGNLPSCLLTDAPLRHAYARGLFTKQEIQQAAQQVQQSNHALTERFKRLAGIIK